MPILSTMRIQFAYRDSSSVILDDVKKLNSRITSCLKLRMPTIIFVILKTIANWRLEDKTTLKTKP